MTRPARKNHENKQHSAEPVFFPDPPSFRQWLERNSSTATELFVGFMKRSTGAPSMTWPESVDEALCFGWIDGVRKSIDHERYQIRFTPRRAGSKWSAINIRRVAALEAKGRMTPKGLAAFNQRREKGSGYSYEDRKDSRLGPAQVRLFKATPHAWDFFKSQAQGYRQTLVWWIMNAAKEETTLRRLNRVIEASAAGNRLFR